MKKTVSAAAILSALLLSCSYAPSANAGDGLAGNWTGESICTVRPSPCKDEKVIFHVTEPDAAGSMKIRADKIVNGQPEDMGTLDCKFDPKTSTVSCSMEQGLWEFEVKGKKMDGTLKLPNGTIFRRVSVVKSEN